MYIAVFQIMFLDFSLISQFRTHVHLFRAASPKRNSIPDWSPTVRQVSLTEHLHQTTNRSVTWMTAKLKVAQMSLFRLFLHVSSVYPCVPLTSIRSDGRGLLYLSVSVMSAFTPFALLNHWTFAFLYFNMMQMYGWAISFRIYNIFILSFLILSFLI